MKKTILVFGASGQAGYYLTDLLLEQGHDVVGTYYSNPEKINAQITRKLSVNVGNSIEIRDAILYTNPDEIYNLASLMYAPDSWNNPLAYNIVNYAATVVMLEVLSQMSKQVRFFQAGSAEIFDLKVVPQHEETPKRPRNPYGVAKLAAQEIVRVYRENKNIFACTGIFFNMESPLRGDTFFTSKVIKAVAKMKIAIDAGKSVAPTLELGKLHAIRDWGYTKEYMEAANLMMQAPSPDDYIIATGEARTCRDFVLEAFRVAGISDEQRKHLLRYQRSGPRDSADVIIGHPVKIHQHLGWQAKTKCFELINLMLEAELEKLKKEA